MTESSYSAANSDPNLIWTISSLARVFDMDRRTIKKRLDGVKQTGMVKGHPAYLLCDAAPAVFGKAYYAKEGDLKPTDRKAYYESELKRIELEAVLGNYMHTDEAHQYLADLFKEMDLRLSILPDNIERKEGIKAELTLSIEQEVDKIRLLLVSAIDDVEEKQAKRGN